MGAGSGPPRGVRILHHGADELLIQQNSVPDREITFPVQEGTQNAHLLSSLLSNLIDVRRPIEILSRLTPNNKCCRPIRLVPRRVLLFGAG